MKGQIQNEKAAETDHKEELHHGVRRSGEHRGARGCSAKPHALYGEDDGFAQTAAHHVVFGDGEDGDAGHDQGQRHQHEPHVGQQAFKHSGQSAVIKAGKSQNDIKQVEKEKTDSEQYREGKVKRTPGGE